MSFLDFRADPSSDQIRDLPAPAAEGWRTVDLGDTYADRGIDGALRKAAAVDFEKRCLPAGAVSREVGNCYIHRFGVRRPGVRGGRTGELPRGQRGRSRSHVQLRLRLRRHRVQARRPTLGGGFSLGGMQKAMNINERQEDRLGRTPKYFTKAMDLREQSQGKAGYMYQPSGAADDLFPGTFYLAEVNDKYHRRCERTPVAPSAA